MLKRFQALHLRSQRFQLLWITAALVVLLWGALAVDMAHRRENTLARSHGEISNLTLAFSKQIEASLKTIDVNLQGLREHWHENPASFAKWVEARQIQLENEFAFQVAVIDRDGLLVFSSLDPHTKPLDLSDREHFRVHRLRSTDELFISKPVLGRVSKRWSIQFTRPIRGFAGRFEGVIVLSVSPEYFYSFYKQIQLPPHSIIALVRDDGEILSRFPAPEQALGRKLAEAPFLDTGSARSGIYEKASEIDSVERRYAWRKVDKYDSYVMVGHALNDIMSPYREARFRTLLGGAVLSLLLMAVGWIKWRSVRQAEEDARCLADNEERWRLALEAAGDGVWDWDLATDHVVYSAGWKKVLGLKPADIFDHVGDWKMRVHPDDFQHVMHELQNHLDGVTPAYSSEHRLRCKDGQWKWVLDRGMVMARDDQGRPLRVVGVHTDISERKEMEASLRRLATTDPLTGLQNRRCFMERLETEFQRFQRYPASKIGVLMLDLDYFKQVNDRYGHAVGDAALKHFSQLLLGSFRHTDTVARMGGEEFAVLVIETDEAQARQLAARFGASLRNQPLECQGHTVAMTVSIGLAMASRQDQEGEDLLRRADQALYAAKRLGRDRVEVEPETVA